MLDRPPHSHRGGALVWLQARGTRFADGIVWGVGLVAGVSLALWVLK